MPELSSNYASLDISGDTEHGMSSNNDTSTMSESVDSCFLSSDVPAQVEPEIEHNENTDVSLPPRDFICTISNMSGKFLAVRRIITPHKTVYVVHKLSKSKIDSDPVCDFKSICLIHVL